MTSQLVHLKDSLKVFARSITVGVARLHWRDWLMMAVFSALVVSYSSYIYLEHLNTQKQIEEQRLKLNAKNVYQLWKLGLEQRLLAMDRMADRFHHKSAVEYKKWKRDAANYFQQMPGFSAIQWIDKDNFLQWLYPENNNSPLFGKKLNQESSRLKTLSMAVRQRKGRLTPAIDLMQGGRGFLSFHPTFDRKDQHTGFIVGIYKADDYFQSMISADFSARVEMDGKVVFSSEKDIDDRSEITEFSSNIRGRHFQVAISPQKQWVSTKLGIRRASHSFLLLLLLASGLLIFATLFLMIAYRNMKISLREKQGYQKELVENFEKVASSEQLLHQAQEIAKMGNWSFNVESGVIRWSDQMYRIFPEEKSKGEPNFERHMSTIHPDDREMWKSTVSQCMEDARPYVMHFRTEYDDGRVVWVEARGQGRRSEKGEVTDLFGTCQDITEKKEMEEAVQQQERIAQHQARLASIGQLAAGVGHEINNPLTIISGYLEIIESKVAEVSLGDEKLLNMFGKLKLAVFRIRQITQGLRNFARKEDEESREMNLKGEINKTLAVTEEIFQKEGVKVEFESMPDTLCFLGPPGQLQQVILNLMMNSKDAMEQADSKVITIRPKIEGRRASIQIEDQGGGVPRNIQEKIFEPFFTTKDVNKGTGLGLSLSQKIMKDHGGELNLLHSDSKGSIFEITLPVFEGQTPLYDNYSGEGAFGREVDFRESPVRAPLMNALIVDDEPDILSIVTSMISELPIKVETVPNGKEALVRLSERSYDILLTDLKMAEMDGETLLEHVYSSGMDKNLKIYVMTGGVDQRIENNFKYRNKVDGYFLKPFDDSMLKAFAGLCAQGVKDTVGKVS